MNFYKSKTICLIIFDEPFMKKNTLVKNVTRCLLRLANDTSQHLWVHKINI